MLDRLARMFSGQVPTGRNAPVAAADRAAPSAAAEDAKNRGNAHLVKGELVEAGDCYRQAIAIDPFYAEAYNNYGHLCLRQGDLDEAERLLNRAIALNPALANGYFNLGNVCQARSDAANALVNYQRALDLAPDNADVLHRCAEALYALGRTDEALSRLRQAIRLSPDTSLLHYNLAMILRHVGQTQEAIACLNKTIALAPNFVEAYCDLGRLLRDKKELDAAALYFEKAIAMRPDDASIHRDRGIVMLMLEDHDAAAESLREAIRVDPNFADGHMTLAEVLQKQGRLDEAFASVNKAIALAPQTAESHVVKGLIFKDNGRFADAEDCLRHALTLKQGDEAIRFAMSTVLLASGRFDEGWELFGRRFHYGELTDQRDFGHHEWSGEDLSGKSIVVWRDQGVGDEILFASLLPDIITRSRRCVVECANKLLPLFARSFPDAVVVPKMEPPHPATRDDIDFQIALADTARWLRPTLESFPDRDHYLVPDPARVDHWQARLSELGPGLKVGFSWRSSLVRGQRGLHYTHLSQWGPIFSIPGVHFINLQYDRCADELDEARQRFGIRLHAFGEVDLFDDLAEAAALKQALDLVISAPTATAFLAAAVGTSTWMMSYATPWQMLGTDHVPWFPSMRCFPRRWNQDWNEIIADIARQLAALSGTDHA